MFEDHGFHLFTSNRLSSLLGMYSRSRRGDALRYRRDGGVFTVERIAVATRGMGTWVEHSLVGMGHVMAGVEFPFLRDAIDGVLSRYARGLEGLSYHPERFSEEALTWRLYRLLGELAAEGDEATYGHLLQYLRAGGGERGEVRRYELSAKLASVYYDYMSFIPEKLHPELVREYRGVRDNWQQLLWCRLCGGEESPASVLLRFLGAESLSCSDYEPLTFFGVSAMPPYFLRVLRKLATVTHVNVFYLNHCDAFWGDICRHGGLRCERLREGNAELDEHFENTLLCQLGMQGRDFFNAVVNLDNEIDEESSSWESGSGLGDEEPDDACRPVPLLRAIQERIVSRTNPESSRPLASWDDSLTVHSCYHGLREVESLRDCLLQVLSVEHELHRADARHPRLTLNDIIVMAPDISEFAPLIRTVFDACPELRGHYCISDRSVRSANLLAESFLELLSIGETSFEVSRIRRLLDSPALRARFGFDESAMERIDVWLRRAAIRWGRDGESRREDFGGEAVESFSWRQGLDRLLLKMAFDSDESSEERSARLVYGGLLSADISTGAEPLQSLGALCRFFDELCALSDELGMAGGRTGASWCELLRRKREVFFRASAETALDYALLGKALDGLSSALSAAGLLEELLPFAPLRAALESVLESPAPGEPFLGGKITCCSMLPMRGIPCRVIALLGMDAGAFPRPDRSVGFSLIPSLESLPSESPERWLYAYTRQRGKEDRFTFLEALMSAQDYLMVFYHGRNEYTLKDDLLPAAPVTELMQYAAKVREGSIEVRHALNPFDASAYGECGSPALTVGADGCHTGALRRVFSYDRPMFAVVESARRGLEREAASASAEAESGSESGVEEELLPSPSRLWDGVRSLGLPEALPFGGVGRLTVGVSELVSFLKDASAHYLHHRLGFARDEYLEEALSDYEPFEDTDLQASRHCQRLLRHQIGAESLDEVYLTLAEAEGALAPESPLKARLWGLYREWRARGELPPGLMGLEQFRREQEIACWDIGRMREESELYKLERYRKPYLEAVSEHEVFKEEMALLREEQVVCELGEVEVQGLYDELREQLGIACGAGTLPSVRVTVTGAFEALPVEGGPSAVRLAFYSTSADRYYAQAYVEDLALLASFAGDAAVSRGVPSQVMQLKRGVLGVTRSADGKPQKELGKLTALPELTVGAARERLRRVVGLYLVGQLLPVPLFGVSARQLVDPSLLVKALAQGRAFERRQTGDCLLYASWLTDGIPDVWREEILRLAARCY